MTWQENKQWSDKFLVDIKRILGEYLIGEATKEDDTFKNTDLIVLKMEAVRIGCRVRRHQYIDRFGGDFTIRAKLPSGNKTELTKIIEGWGDYFFYGFANEDESGLAVWNLANLDVFRLWFNRRIVFLDRGQMPGKEYNNSDGLSCFRSFEWKDLPSEFVIASKVVDKDVNRGRMSPEA